ncbi:predicted protein [Plenodomus lingam JN3]|uniref:Predicted protein n=1 Tax=Leptosphaeria maculans (strain JN3 / isolate v23.1.3 / race Av1-4-5-6-7-8) TaxID=985895 RepID=E4ZHD3_LEPMJ|nr:predicted protein [Plenodomus lingam JN3]CBX90703.1 predicted protein [Plenodomus lingam JN3]
MKVRESSKCLNPASPQAPDAMDTGMALPATCQVQNLSDSEHRQRFAAPVTSPTKRFRNVHSGGSKIDGKRRKVVDNGDGTVALFLSYGNNLCGTDPAEQTPFAEQSNLSMSTYMGSVDKLSMPMYSPRRELPAGGRPVVGLRLSQVIEPTP